MRICAISLYLSYTLIRFQLVRSEHLYEDVQTFLTDRRRFSMAEVRLRFQDKVAIVTGGCSGIGKGCLEVLVENGGKVALFDINGKEGNRLQDESDGRILYVHCDVTNEKEIQQCIERTVEEFGRLDCLVNNVEHHPGSHSIDQLTVEGFKNLLNINVVSMFAMAKYALPHLRRVRGSIINISSFSGTNGQGLSSSYCSTKGAISSLTKALAIDEAKHGVRVNAICPGPVNTPPLRDWLETLGEKGQHVLSWAQLGRYAESREIGQACLFLATEATFSTGIDLMCTGGCEIGYGVKSDF